MRKFNQALNKDITELKTLHMKKDKTEFRKRKAEIIKQHKISKATVYREMKKDSPGTYNSPRYNPPVREVTGKEKELVGGMLYRQMPIERIRSEMEKQSGQSYSWDRIDMIRKQIESESDSGKKNLSPAANESAAPMREGDMIKYESPHGMEMKLFLGKVLNIEKMAPGSLITIDVKGYGVTLGSDAVHDMQRIAANTTAGRGYDALEVARINSKHMCIEQVRYISYGEAHTIKDLVEINKILDSFESTGRKPGIDFEFLVDVVKHFTKGKVKREEIVFFVSRNSDDYAGLSKEMNPSYDESMDANSKWAEEHM